MNKNHRTLNLLLVLIAVAALATAKPMANLNFANPNTTLQVVNANQVEVNGNTNANIATATSSANNYHAPDINGSKTIAANQNASVITGVNNAAGNNALKAAPHEGDYALSVNNAVNNSHVSNGAVDSGNFAG